MRELHFDNKRKKFVQAFASGTFLALFFEVSFLHSSFSLQFLAFDCVSQMVRPFVTF